MICLPCITSARLRATTKKRNPKNAIGRFHSTSNHLTQTFNPNPYPNPGDAGNDGKGDQSLKKKKAFVGDKGSSLAEGYGI